MPSKALFVWSWDVEAPETKPRTVSGGCAGAISGLALLCFVGILQNMFISARKTCAFLRSFSDNLHSRSETVQNVWDTPQPSRTIPIRNDDFPWANYWSLGAQHFWISARSRIDVPLGRSSGITTLQPKLAKKKS